MSYMSLYGTLKKKIKNKSQCQVGQYVKHSLLKRILILHHTTLSLMFKVEKQGWVETLMIVALAQQ